MSDKLCIIRQLSFTQFGPDDMARASKNAKKPHPPRYRMMFRFWMDAGKDDELAIADYCEEQKSKRSFTSTMRDAIRLIMDLRQQKLDVLFQLFPWVNAWLEERAEAIASTKRTGNNGDDSGGNVIDLAAQIARLENLLLQQASGGSGLLMAAKQEKIRALPAPRSAPDMEDTTLINITKMTGSTDITGNFLQAMSTISGVDFAPAPAQSSGIKKMAVQPLTAPSFDDDETLLLMTQPG